MTTGSSAAGTDPKSYVPASSPGQDTAAWFAAPAVLVAAHLVLALLVFEPTLFPGADPGHYMVLGESLRGGTGFRDIQLPGAPLHARFPPGYPLVLAVAGWFGSVQLFKALSLAFTAGSVWLTYRIAGQFTGRGPALIGAALFAIAPLLLDYSHRVLSEAAFIFLLLGAVAATQEGRRVGAVALAAAAAAFFTRTAGLAVLLALVLWAILSRDRWRVAWAVGVAAICVVGWAVYQHVVQPSQPGYLQQLVQENPYFPSLGTIGPVDLAARSVRNLWRYISSEFPGSFGFATLRRGTVPITAVVGAVLSSLVLIGWFKSAVAKLRSAHLLLALYFGLILLWPSVWTDRRFLLPVLPLLSIFGVVGAQAAVYRLGSRAGTAVLALIGAGVAATSLLATTTQVPERVACQVSFRHGQPCDPGHYRQFYAMARWAAENTPEGSVIANRSPATFFLFSRRQGDLYRFSKDDAVVMHGLEEMGADYVLIDRLSATTELYLIPAVVAHPDRFELVQMVGKADFTFLLRMVSAPRTAAATVP